MAVKLSDKKKRDIFQDIASKSQYQVGLEHGLDKYVGDNNIKIINAVRKIYTEVSEDPKKFGLTTDIVEMVDKGLEGRKNKKGKIDIKNEDYGDLEEDELKNLVLTVRNKVWQIADKKLDHIAKSKKQFNNTSISQLVNILGMTFDKSQIVKGEATDHIAMKAQINDGMTPNELMSEILKIRERRAVSEDN